MKKINILYSIMALVFAFTSCNDEDGITVIPEQPSAAEILNPNGSTSYTLIKENDAGAFETFIWDDAYFSEGAEIEYTVQMDLATGDFSNPVVLGTTSENSLKTIVKDINLDCRELGVVANLTTGLQVRVVAKSGAEVKNSIPVSFLVNRYIYDDEKPVWLISSDDLDANIPLTFDSENNIWKTNTSITLTDGNFVFFNNNVYQDQLMASVAPEYALEMSGSLVEEGGAAIPMKSWNYFVTLDAENMTYNVEEDTYYTLAGDAVSDTEAKFVADGDNYVLKAKLDAGTFMVKFNSTSPISYGATSESDATLVADGTAFTVATAGDYQITIDADMKLSMEEMAYPSQMYITGSFCGWDWASEDLLTMIPVHSNPHLFWKIAWFDADQSLKFNSSKAWDGNEFGTTGSADAEGIFATGGDNAPSGTAGYKMVVVNLLTGTVQITDPIVYAMGSAFGGWDGGEFLFTADPSDEKVLVSPAAVVDDNARMYVTASSLTNGDGNVVDWWQAEFNVFSGVIEYRAAGNDQAAAPITTGQVVKLNFSTESGVFE